MLSNYYYPDPYEMMQIINTIKKIERKRKKMKFTVDLIIMILKGLYPILRPILFDAIDNPNYQWDDYLMKMLDHAFDSLDDMKGE